MSDYEYTLELTPYEVTQGKEQLVEDTKGNVYAGEWMRGLLDETDDDEVLLGYFDDPVRGSNEPAKLPLTALYRHVAVTGMTGYGKSNFIQNHLLQLAERGTGFCFFDPKGQDARDLLMRIPDDRMDDVVWVDPTRADESVGFNAFATHRDPDDDGFEVEVRELTQAFVNILKAGKAGWGATMDDITKTVASQLIRADEDYTPLDMYAILNDKDQRQRFAEEFGDDIEAVYLERLANYSDEDFDPLFRRFMEWADNTATRRAMWNPRGLSYGELVEEDKLVIVDLSNIPSNDVQALVATGMVRGIWAAQYAHMMSENGGRTPFFLALDEFDLLVRGEMDIEDILSKGRSLRLGTFLAFQQLEQVPESVQDAIMGNVDNLFTFNPGPGQMSTAGRLAQAYDIGANRLTDLSQYEFVGRLITRDNQKTDPFNISCIAPLPPLRSNADVDVFIREFMEAHGHETDGEEVDFSDFGL